MKKFKIFVDMDEEEKYLNTMAKNGYILKKYNSAGFYTFEKSAPRDLHYKIDYRVFKNKSDFEQYKTLFEDAGWIHVFGTKYSGGQYFLPGSDNAGSPEIFSDAESKAARYKRFLNQCSLVLAFTLIYFSASLVSYNYNLKMVYLTPGLWEKTGADFWTAFLFETPFALLRVSPFIISVFLTVIYGYWAAKARKLYKKGIQSNI